jgi:hypothetical protein
MRGMMATPWLKRGGTDERSRWITLRKAVSGAFGMEAQIRLRIRCACQAPRSVRWRTRLRIGQWTDGGGALAEGRMRRVELSPVKGRQSNNQSAMSIC